jgi:predicted nucleic acid-binding protein
VTLPFLDTNILLRHFLQDHPEHSPRASDYLARIERGEIEVHIAETVVFETVFMLERRYKRAKLAIREAVLSLIELPGVILPGKQDLREMLDLYVDLNVSIVDAYHAVTMKRLGLGEIVTFDRDFDRFPGITRVEP